VDPRKGTPQAATTPRELGRRGSTLVPGVVVRPDVKPSRHLLYFAGSGKSSSPAPVDHSLTIPFSGEYQVFPSSSARLQHEWAVDHGTLLENAYITATGGSLETEAFQPLQRPVDFANCGKVRLVVTSQEKGPFAASMQLIGAGGVLDLGLEMAGFDRQSEEALDFSVPAAPRTLLINGIRISFHQVPRQGVESMKVVVQRFTLEPRVRPSAN